MTGVDLFTESIPAVLRPFTRPEYALEDAKDDPEKIALSILWQIMIFTGQEYPPVALDFFPLRDQFFDKDGTFVRSHSGMAYVSMSAHFYLFKGKLKCAVMKVTCPLERCMRDVFDGPEEDLQAACAIMRECLHLNPWSRPSAEALLNHPWLQLMS